MCEATGVRLPKHFLLQMRAELTSSSQHEPSQDKGQRRLACIVPDMATTEHSKLTAPSSYVLNSSKILTWVGSKANRFKTLINLRMIETVALRSNVSPHSIDRVHRTFSWNAHMTTLIEQLLLEDVKKKFLELSPQQRGLVELKDKHASQNVAFYLKFNAELSKIDTMNEKQCFSIKDLDQSWHSKMFGIIENRHTLPLRLAVNKLFAYKDEIV